MLCHPIKVIPFSKQFNSLTSINSPNTSSCFLKSNHPGTHIFPLNPARLSPGPNCFNYTVSITSGTKRPNFAHKEIVGCKSGVIFTFRPKHPGKFRQFRGGEVASELKCEPVSYLYRFSLLKGLNPKELPCLKSSLSFKAMRT